MSVRSQAPANAGAGRGMNLHRDSGMSGFEEVDVEGAFSVFTVFMDSRDVMRGGRVLAGLFVVRCLFIGEGPFLSGLTAFFLL